ncbi:MAG: hypothetical protein ACTHV8_09835 [Nesterenkonia sp.]
MNQLKHFQHPRFARRWIRLSAGLEHRGLAGLREQTLAGLAGRVIEVGCGNGLNFRHYPAAVDEIRRVLRPGGQLRFLEHVRARNRMGARFQDLISPISAKLNAGCRQGRDTASAIEGAGFAMSALERFSFPDHPWVPGQPMIRGSAALPGETPV